MKVSLSWLKELVAFSSDVQDISESLSMSGFEVEELNDLTSSIDGVVIGFVKNVEKHPNANKLKICIVDIGKTETLQIVCGAENVREGIHVLVATKGAYLKAINLKIKPSSIRGVDSNVLIYEYDGRNMILKSYYIIILREHIKSKFNTHHMIKYVITFFVKHGCHTHFHEVLQTTLKS